jgi:hypothetical protein
MRKGTFFVMLAIALAAKAAAKETLAILPFTGGQEQERETIAELFSFNPRLNAVFSPIPGTTIVKTIGDNPDASAANGQHPGAKYLAAGNITKLGKKQLLVISILNTEDFRQTAGDFQIYANIEDIREKLPGMVDNLISTAMESAGDLPKLAVVPVQAQGVDEQTANSLAQVLSIHMSRSGNYVVYPQISNLEEVKKTYETRASGAEEAEASLITSPDQVLSVVGRQLGELTMFNAVVIDVASGLQLKGTSVDYETINDGLNIMKNLAVALAGETRSVVMAASPAVGGNIVHAVDAEPASPTLRMLGTGGLNMIGGLGSFLKKDWIGGATVLAGLVTAGGFLAWELSLPQNDPLANIPGNIAVGVAGVAIIYGFVRPFIYNQSRTVAEVLDGVHVAVAPDANGGQALSLSYGLRY